MDIGLLRAKATERGKLRFFRKIAWRIFGEYFVALDQQIEANFNEIALRISHAESDLVAIKSEILTLETRLDTAIDVKINSELVAIKSEISTLKAKLDTGINVKINSEIDARFDSEIGARVNSQINEKLDSEIGAMINSEVDAKIISEINAKIDSDIDEKILPKLRRIIPLEKNTMAIASRLAGLEDEANDFSSIISELRIGITGLLSNNKDYSYGLENLAGRVSGIENTTATITDKLNELDNTTAVSANKLKDHEIATENLENKLQDIEKQIFVVSNNFADFKDANLTSIDQLRKHSEAIVEFIRAVQNDMMTNNTFSNERVTQLNERIAWITELLKEKNTAAVASLQYGMNIVRNNTATFLVQNNDFIGGELIAGFEWEPHVRKNIERFANPDRIAIDAGAYIGIHTVTLSRLFKEVHSFEPQLQIFRMLCANLALNQCFNVTTYNQALYDKKTRMKISPPDKQTVAIKYIDNHLDYSAISNAASLAFEETNIKTDSVSAITIDSLKLENVGIIKIDVQGSDLHVMRGASETIRRCRPAVLFEWEKLLYEEHDSSLEDVMKFFTELDYQVTLINDTTPGYQADYCAEPL